MDAPDAGFVGEGVEFGEAVEEGGEGGVDDAVDVAVFDGRVRRVEGWEFEGEGGGRGEPFAEGGSFAVGVVGCGGDVGEAEAGDGGAGGVALGAGVGEGAGGGGFEVGVVEALEDAEVGVEGEVGDDVGLVVVRGGGLRVGVDGVEGEEGRAGVCGEYALVGWSAVDDVPEAGFGRVEGRDGVEHVAVVEEGEAAESVMRAPDAQDDMLLGQKERVQIGGRGIGDGGQDGGLVCRRRDMKDAVDGCFAGGEVVIEDISSDRICLDMRG